MKFRMNGKECKATINSVLVKGKWNSGTISKNMSLLSNIVISIGDDCYMYNGDNHTYVRSKLNVDAEADIEEGRITVDAETLLKYLSNEETNFSLKDNILKLVSPTKTVKIPVLERHSNNDAIIRTTENYTIHTDMEKVISISPKTTLDTRIKLSSKELTQAIEACESVGNSIFQLDFDGELLHITSSNDTEEVTVALEPIEILGDKATMEVSAPFHKYLGGVTTILTYNDDAPLSIISGGFVMLRAPRIGV